MMISTIFLYFLTGFIGISVGSFLNVVIVRLPIMMKRQWEEECHQLHLAKHVTYRSSRQRGLGNHLHFQKDFKLFNLFYPPSHCPYCRRLIPSKYNIPVVSFFMLGGKCSACQHPISWRYPLVEGITGLFFIVLVYHFGLTFLCLAALIFTALLLTMIFIDWEHQLLPDCLTLLLLWAGLLVNVQNGFVSLDQAVIGAVAGYLSLWLIVRVFYFFTGKVGMGEGDFKLFAALGAWFGWTILPMLMLIAALSGLIGGLLLLKMRRQGRNTPIPFGPFLALAGWYALFFFP